MINIPRAFLIFLLTLLVLGISNVELESGTIPNQPTDQAVDSSDITNPLFMVKVNGLMGYINLKGEIIIEPQYYESREFSEGLALVFLGTMENHECAYIDKSGKFAIEPPSPGRGDFLNGLARAYVIENGKIIKGGFIDKTGKWAIEPIYEDIRDFSEGLAAVRIGKTFVDSWGYIDTKGKLVIPPQFDSASGFSDGLARIVLTEYGYYYGFLNKEG